MLHSYAKSEAILELLSTAKKRIQWHVCIIILTVDRDIFAGWRQINRFFCFQIMFHKIKKKKKKIWNTTWLHLWLVLHFLDSNKKFNLIFNANIYCKWIMDHTPVNQTFKTGFLYDLSSTLTWIKRMHFCSITFLLSFSFSLTCLGNCKDW